MKYRQEETFIKDLLIEIVGFIIKIEFHPFTKSEKYYDTFYERQKFIKEIKKYFSNFIGDTSRRNIDFTIIVESEPLNFIKNTKLRIISTPIFTTVSKKKIKTSYHISIFQFQIILKDILFQLVTKTNGCVIHGSSLAINNKAHLFLGKSTAGKSTIIRLLKNIFNPIADDIVIIRKKDEKYFVYITPFIEKQWWIRKENKKYELTKVFFIYKNEQSSLRRLFDSTLILELWLNQVLIPRKDKKNILLWNIEFIKSSILFYNLKFRKNKKDLEQLFNS